jgi:signal transduction histidine kinase
MRTAPAAIPESASEAAASIPLYRTEVDVAHLVTSALAPLDRDCGMRDVTLEVEAGGATGARAKIDPEKIAWAVTMLVGNALRHVKRGTRMHPGGSIRVVVERDDQRNVVVSVHDDGAGMAPERVRALFERHGDAVHAPALGLSLARDIARAHGGELHVESHTDAIDHGTTVRLSLPMS